MMFHVESAKDLLTKAIIGQFSIRLLRAADADVINLTFHYRLRLLVHREIPGNRSDLAEKTINEFFNECKAYLDKKFELND